MRSLADELINLKEDLELFCHAKEDGGHLVLACHLKEYLLYGTYLKSSVGDVVRYWLV